MRALLAKSTGDVYTLHILYKGKKMYHIVFNGDEKYVPYICVCMASIIEFTDKNKSYENLAGQLSANEDDRLPAGEAYCFHLLIDALSDEMRRKLCELEKELNSCFPCRIEVHILDDLLFVEFPRWRRSYAAYYRILLARFVPSETNRVLYLDGDTLVQTDIRPFMLQDMQEKVLCAVPNYPQLRHVLPGKKGAGVYSFQNYACYFNSGVMLIDLQKWREEDAEKKVIEFLNSYHVICPDQDALNAVFKDRVKILPYQWNLMWNNTVDPEDVRKTWKECPEPFASEDFYENLDQPKIIHFSVKPWNSNGFRISQDFRGFYYPNMAKWWNIAEKMPVFSDYFVKLRESAEYCDMLKANARQEKLLQYAWYRLLLKLKRNMRPYMRKFEKPFKILRDKRRIAKRKKQ